MPVFVEWKWLENTETLLTIFHFYDDFSKPNLRLVKLGDDIETSSYSSKGKSELKKAWISWAPSHLEMALLMQILSYANIINGLKPSERKEFRLKLESKDEFFELPFAKRYGINEIAVPENIRKRIGTDKKVILYANLREHVEGYYPLYTCVELCPEYINYLKKILKPYLK